MTGTDPLDRVRAELEELADRPLDEHPDALERVHGLLADELDRSGR